MYMKLAAFFIAIFMSVGLTHADTLLIDKLDSPAEQERRGG
jgi:hypothetical protein